MQLVGLSQAQGHLWGKVRGGCTRLWQNEVSGQDLSTTCKSSCTPNEWQEEWSVTIGLGSGGGLLMSCQDSKIKGQRDKGDAS